MRGIGCSVVFRSNGLRSFCRPCTRPAKPLPVRIAFRFEQRGEGSGATILGSPVRSLHPVARGTHIAASQELGRGEQASAGCGCHSDRVNMMRAWGLLCPSTWCIRGE